MPFERQAVALECFVPSYIFTRTPTVAAASFQTSRSLFAVHRCSGLRHLARLEAGAAGAGQTARTDDAAEVDDQPLRFFPWRPTTRPKFDAMGHSNARGGTPLQSSFRVAT